MIKKKSVKTLKKFIKAGLFILPAIGLVIGMSKLTVLQKYISYASQIPADLIINTQQSAGVPSRPWTNIAQGGESKDFNLKPYKEQFAELGTKYLRIDHLYDFYIDVQRDSSGKLIYDFKRLDALLDEMKHAGVSPFISLSYMPAVLGGDITGQPSNWVEYQTIIQRTIQHISGKSELNFKDVYYEVWNEPDLFGNWKTYGDKKYQDLYLSSARAAEKVTNTHSFKIGGPGTTKLYANWISSLMKLVTENNLRLDFISWHNYTGNPQDYSKDTKALKRMMANYSEKARTLEIIISEWGPDSENNPIYDNTVSAAHVVSSIIEMMPIIDKAFVFELEDGKSPTNEAYWGRWGLYTHTDFDNRIKPRAEALKLLNQLGTDRLLLTGNGSFVRGMAAKNNQTIQVLISNYDQEGKHNEEVPIAITGLNPGKYTFTKTFLSRSKYSQTIEVVSDTYKTSVILAPNVVVLLELTPSP